MKQQKLLTGTAGIFSSQEEWYSAAQYKKCLGEQRLPADE
jgi:hypothetical protein